MAPPPKQRGSLRQLPTSITKPAAPKVDSNGLFAEPERVQRGVNPFADSKDTMIQENYMSMKKTNSSSDPYKNMNQALLPAKSNGMHQFQLEPSEKIDLCYDVWRQGGNNQSVMGRFVVSNYRLRFIENGKRENQNENYYSCSMPFGAIHKVV